MTKITQMRDKTQRKLNENKQTSGVVKNKRVRRGKNAPADRNGRRAAQQ